MVHVHETHYKSQSTTQLVVDIIFNQEFNTLCNELARIYKKASMDKPEQEAFQDAFYSILTQRDAQVKALSL
ncbi:hypothetical protein BR63_04975 [Thermanaerosceptrum fracticalcis]|uniref:Uncharacterized protein n=1 Tax=Thermanaerosceptrum fracticalcis TaxID=1712410 RepID=A0A7G6E0W5_THEFR|nr:hypothetical protein [Thermanaerosceptrum fracticalcis]QNB45719.1 hypothetical protein BR63_04975 [Thermanaerosceptrum fracticalcis]